MSYGLFKTFTPVDVNGDDITATNGSGQDLYMPAGVAAEEVFIQIFPSTVTNYDPWVAGKPFGVSSGGSAPYLYFDGRGFGVNVKKDAGGFLAKIIAAADDVISCAVLR